MAAAAEKPEVEKPKAGWLNLLVDYGPIWSSSLSTGIIHRMTMNTGLAKCWR